jgi:endonuclease YncB( thermonuclease family)
MRVVILAAMMLLGAPAQAANLAGVPRIIDGNTLAIGATKIRLERIDAPETDQVCLNDKGIRWNCGIDARDQLAAHIAGRDIKCTSNGVDAYRRTLPCYLADEDLNGWMVQQGWALPNFRHSFVYVKAEENARTQKRGLWQGAFIAPWDWRHRNNNTTIMGALKAPTAQAILLNPSATANAPSPECTIKGNITRVGRRIYHVQSQKSYAKIKMDRAARDGSAHLRAEAGVAWCKEVIRVAANCWCIEQRARNPCIDCGTFCTMSDGNLTAAIAEPAYHLELCD